MEISTYEYLEMCLASGSHFSIMRDRAPKCMKSHPCLGAYSSFVICSPTFDSHFVTDGQKQPLLATKNSIANKV